MTRDPWATAPTLHGRYVTLRPLSIDDADALAAAHDDPDTLRFFPYGIESEPPTARTVQHALASNRQTLALVDVRTGAVTGTTSLYNMSELHGRATIGYTWISAATRGTGINAESKLLLLQHVFDTLGARRVEFIVDELNSRSRAAVHALGAQQEGALRQHARRRDGSWRTSIVYSVIDSEWPDVRAHLQARIGLPQ